MSIDETLAPSSVSALALAELTWLNIGDICAAFGLTSRTPLRGVAEVLAYQPAQRFAQQLLTLDQLVGSYGLSAGATWICQHYSDGLQVKGAIPPRTGPLLIVANHPGLLDAATLFTAIPRTDLRILAITRPLLQALPQISNHLLAVGADPVARTATLRRAARHLQAGGALLTFPAGQIEPDPVRDPGGAHASLATWSSSLDWLVRLAGPLTVQVAIVGGVVNSRALQHPLIRLRQTPQARQYLAAILQIMYRQRYRVSVRAQFGQPWLEPPTAAPAAAPLSLRIQGMAHTLIDAVAQS